MAGKHSYFAYGSNLCVRQMAQRCPDASDPRRATLSDHDWLINERGVATVERFAGAEVHGVIWQLSDHDLATLDSADLTGAILTEAVLSGVVAADAILTKADLSAADLSDADFSKSTGTGSLFLETILTGADFSGVDVAVLNQK